MIRVCFFFFFCQQNQRVFYSMGNLYINLSISFTKQIDQEVKITVTTQTHRLNRKTSGMLFDVLHINGLPFKFTKQLKLWHWPHGMRFSYCLKWIYINLTRIVHLFPKPTLINYIPSKLSDKRQTNNNNNRQAFVSQCLDISICMRFSQENTKIKSIHRNRINAKNTNEAQIY